ncbi:MAG: hypothetical protein QG635_1163, partial [Bacteroidota bacterium]|nr:hypothetical protein [Bacteroidota bacterium]
MEITVKNEQNIIVFTLKGRFDSLGAADFNYAIEETGESARFFVLDMQNVDYMSSVGLRSILNIEKNLRSRKGKCIYTGIGSNIESVFEMSGLKGSLSVLSSTKEAIAVLTNEINAPTTITASISNGKNYEISNYQDAAGSIELWHSFIDLSSKITNVITPEPASLEELEMSFGIGGFGANPGQAINSLGNFFSFHDFAALIPAEPHCCPDYLVNQKPADTEIFIHSAISFSGEPAYNINTDAENVSCRELLSCAFENCGREWFGFTAYSHSASIEAAYFPDKEALAKGNALTKSFSNVPVIIAGIAISIKPESPERLLLLEMAEKTGCLEFHPGMYVNAGCMIFRKETDTLQPLKIKDLRQLVSNIDNFEFTGKGTGSAMLQKPRLWIYQSDELGNGIQKRTKVEFEDTEGIQPDFIKIARKIYDDAGRVVLKKLQGGFAASTFQVESFDRSGRKQLPTVLKIYQKKFGEREISAYNNHVHKFILNNGTSIMGNASSGDWCGLRYNFLGITGSDSRLIWLENYYKEHAIEDVLKMFDRVFTNILKPWYGQPKLDTINLYREHDPMKIFFGSLFIDAERDTGFTTETEFIFCPYLGRELPNPFHFLKYIWKERYALNFKWYKSIIHGDLNLKNILLDEKENIYIIDYSETRVSNIVSDFARLEPILKYELTGICNDEHIKERLEFEQGLASVNSIKEMPKFIYSGSNPSIFKAYQAICRMRQYAATTTIFETDIIPYFLALLEWTLPVVSYYGISITIKRLAAYTAALLTE